MEHEKLPPALRLASVKADRPMPRLRGSQVDLQRLRKRSRSGSNGWIKIFRSRSASTVAITYTHWSGTRVLRNCFPAMCPRSPSGISKATSCLKKTREITVAGKARSGAPCATAFAVLFLLRSTQKSIKASLGEGTLVGGRGLSANLNRMKLRHGKLIVQQETLDADRLLAMLEDPDNQDLDKFVENSAVLDVEHVGAEQARRLQQIIRSGPPESRRLAVRAVARMRRLEYVPSLLYAMTDPDNRIVREARDGLRFISRRY